MVATKINRKGFMIIPKDIRDHLEITSGGSICIEALGTDENGRYIIFSMTNVKSKNFCPNPVNVYTSGAFMPPKELQKSLDESIAHKAYWEISEHHPRQVLFKIPLGVSENPLKNHFNSRDPIYQAFTVLEDGSLVLKLHHENSSEPTAILKIGTADLQKALEHSEHSFVCLGLNRK